MICMKNSVPESGLDLNVESQTGGFCGFPPKTPMHQGKLVFAQLMLYLPLSAFRRCVSDHRGEHKVKDFSCLDQFFAMAFAQLTLSVPKVALALKVALGKVGGAT